MSSTLLHDLRYGARALRGAAGFTIVAVSTLSLGIGANTAMFGVVDALLFKPPAGVTSPRDVMKVRVTVPARGDDGSSTVLSPVLSYPDFVDLRTHARGFASFAAYARNAHISSVKSLSKMVSDKDNPLGWQAKSERSMSSI